MLVVDSQPALVLVKATTGKSLTAEVHEPRGSGLHGAGGGAGGFQWACGLIERGTGWSGLDRA